MILDDLFNQAEQSYQAGEQSINVLCAITTNQTDGLSSQGNSNTAPSQVELFYTPAQRQSGGHPPLDRFIPAFFSNGGVPPVTITSKPIFPEGSNYEVEVLGSRFVPSVDDQTNILYGVAGSVFVTISLCGLFATETPR
jgi:hypothetical protein